MRVIGAMKLKIWDNSPHVADKDKHDITLFT
jgi:hypothetical protein